MITRKVAGWGCSLMLMTSIIAFIIGLTESKTWLIICSSIAIGIYVFGLSIVIYDLKENG